MRRVLYRISLVAVVASAALVAFFVAKVREHHRHVDALIGEADVDAASDSVPEIAVALSDAIYRRTNRTAEPDELDWFSRWESTSPFNVTAGTSLRYGIYGVEGHTTLGACGTMSRTPLNALWELGIPARKLQLLDSAEGAGGGHTLVEVRDGDRWFVISPSDSAFVWRTASGRPATVAEIRGDDALYAQVLDYKADFPYRFDNPKHIRWQKLPGPVRGLIRRIIGTERYESATTPRLYDRPRRLFLVGAAVFLAAFAVLAFLLRPRRTARSPHPRGLPPVSLRDAETSQ